jgi:hypothetical protein
VSDDVVGREEVVELLRLLEWMKGRAILGVNQGKGKRKQFLRTQLTTGYQGMKAALEDIERVAE